MNGDRGPDFDIYDIEGNYEALSIINLQNYLKIVESFQIYARIKLFDAIRDMTSGTALKSFQCIYKQKKGNLFNLRASENQFC